MFYTTIDQYTLAFSARCGEILHTDTTVSFGEIFKEGHSLQSHKPSDYLAIEVSSGEQKPRLLVEGWYVPGPESGFHPGALIVPETRMLFIGAGTMALSFCLEPIQRVATEEADAGFWGWTRFRDTVVMSAELELAGWSIHGQKLWSQYVEPPWSYAVQGDEMIVDVMGDKRWLNIQTGQASQRGK